MEKVYIENLKPGMILGRTIFLADGRIYLRQKAEISANAISKLRELRLPAVYIHNAPDQESTELVSDTTRSDLIQNLYKLDFGQTDVKNINISNCKNSLYELVDEIVRNQRVPLRFTEARLHNDYIYSHMVNVCIISVKIGLQMSYNQLKLAELAIGSVFHDIGMTKIPSEILNRIGGLTSEEMRQVHLHSKDGYELLRLIPGISAVSANVAYQHHERFNGTGYPRGLAGTDIHEFARITAVADVFDAMTTEKIYSHAKSISATIEFIESLKGIEFDPDVVDILTQILG
jgi:HD-GYP domain-containing protein (c-di-GMP phosphodiesterase class II)